MTMNAMNAVNAVLLFILVWTFTAVCQADDDIIVSCDDVTGFVRKEVNLTCSVKLNPDCCIKKYNFKRDENSYICREELPYDSCDQRNSVTCSYTPTTAVTDPFRLFLQTSCGTKAGHFTVSITEPSFINEDKSEDRSTDAGVNNTVISSVLGLSFIIILIIILIAIYCKKRSYGFQRMFLCIKHDEDNSNPPE